MTPVTRKACPRTLRQVQLRGACACSLCLLHHRFHWHRLSIFNAGPYRACVLVSDHEYQIGSRGLRRTIFITCAENSSAISSCLRPFKLPPTRRGVDDYWRPASSCAGRQCPRRPGRRALTPPVTSVTGAVRARRRATEIKFLGRSLGP
jgi:hypothetical protein